MDLKITGHHLEVTEPIREYVEKKFARVFRHIDNAVDASIILTSEQDNPTAKINVRIPGKDVHCETSAETLYAAIDLLADKIDRRLLKMKEKRNG